MDAKTAPNRSDACTHGVRVETESFYVHARSRPAANLFFFGYRIRITNNTAGALQLVSRHWLIRDGMGDMEEVHGPGVVGEQPRLEPGRSFEYTSFCALRTWCGAMQGTYQMRRDDGSQFDVAIGAFALVATPRLN